MGSAATLRDRAGRHDHFYDRARKERFAARSVYKLLEIDERYHLFPPGRQGLRVLDLGCRPGSWLQYVARRTGDSAQLVGLDREPLAITVPRSRILVGDVFSITPETLRGELSGFDVVMSDMGPDTSGIRHMDQARSEALFERALWLAEQLLVPGGHFVGKLFQGPDFPNLLRRCRAGFGEARVIKPQGSRKDSIEQYIVALRRQLPAAVANPPAP
jgi:23S rRNA (uridine2552-2'-O)-methyltransferase